LPDGETGAVTAIQRANSDLRLSPHFHCRQRGLVPTLPPVSPWSRSPPGDFETWLRPALKGARSQAQAQERGRSLDGIGSSRSGARCSSGCHEAPMFVTHLALRALLGPRSPSECT
jgi:hypothetical protein